MNNILFPVYKTNKDNTARFCLGTEGRKPLIFCGLNPSTATKEKSDPTISKVQAFARKFGYDSFLMINLYSLRSTDPTKLPKSFDKRLHNENISVLLSYLSKKDSRFDMVVCWGNKIESREYLYYCFKDIWKNCNQHIKNTYRLGDLTVLNHPKHPSRIGYENKLKQFNIDKYLESIVI
ncbi:MAG: DUF1643 domain-containing protein [Ignavibacteria bacterium]|nr:DUF1643 domain-containing protein [Ignavibacteria bacterium]